MKLTSGFETRRARMEMIPLMDVMFLLLAFFIYGITSMVVHRGLKVDLPQAGSTQSDREQYLSITIDAQNQLFLDRVALTAPAIVEQVLARRQQAGKLPVFIEGDVRADLGVAIDMLDRLRLAGVSEVSFECAEPSR